MTRRTATEPATGLRDQIRDAVVHAECERTPTCSDCIADSVLAAVNTRHATLTAGMDTAADIIRAALVTARDHGSAAGIRVLYERAADVEEVDILDGLNLPTAPAFSVKAAEPEHDDGACTDCATTEGDVWPIVGMFGYFCRDCHTRIIGRAPEGDSR